MAWTFVGQTTTGTFVRAGSSPPTNFTINLPTGVAVGDLLLLQIQVTGAAANATVPVNPTGWTQLALITNGGTGNSRHYYGYRSFTAGTTNPVVSFTGTGSTADSYSARIFAYRPGAGYEWLIDVTGTASTNASQLNIGPATGITPTTLGSPLSTLIVGSFGKANDIGTPTAPANYVGNVTTTTLGSDSGCYHIHRLNAPQTATGNLTVTDTGNAAQQSGVGASILVSFREDPITTTGIALRSFATIC